MWEVIKATPDILAGNIGQCTDKIFSGHTAILLISFLFWRRYATHWAIIVYSGIHASIGILTVLLARYHYTIDVVIGALLTFFVHQTYYSSLDLAIQLRNEQSAQTAMAAWSKLSLSEEEAHALFRASQDMDYDNDAYHEDGGYKMAVFSRTPITGTTVDGGWRDYDSAVGVDISQRDDLVQSVGDEYLQDADRQPFVVRKRETSSATALSSEASDSDNNDCSHNLTVAAVAAHHEITVLDSRTTPGHRDRRVPPLSNSELQRNRPLLPLASIGARRGHSPANMGELMGINRPFGSVLPLVVSWMDGLDLRYPGSQRANM